MAITRVNHSDITSRGLSPVSFSFDVGSANCLIVKVVQDQDVFTNVGLGADSITCDSVALTKFVQLRDETGTMHQIWGLINPTQGTVDIDVTSLLSQDLIISVESYSGVSDTETFPNVVGSANHFFGSGSLTEIQVDVVTTKDDCILVGLGGYRGPSLTNMFVGDDTALISVNPPSGGAELSLESSPLTTGVAGTYHLQAQTGGGATNIHITLLVVALAPAVPSPSQSPSASASPSASRSPSHSFSASLSNSGSSSKSPSSSASVSVSRSVSPSLSPSSSVSRSPSDSAGGTSHSKFLIMF